jgi:hypothetical protein
VGAESPRFSMLRLRLPGLDGTKISVNTDVIDVVREAVGNIREFCRVGGTEDSVSVSTTKHYNVIIVTVQLAIITHVARLG